MSIQLNKINQYSSSKEAAAARPSFWEFMNRDISLFGNRFNAKRKEAFYTELETLLTAGLDIKGAFELLREGTGKKQEQALFDQLQSEIIAGKSLSAAMMGSKEFSEYESFSIQIAEESGALPPVLKELASYFAKRAQYKRLLISALSYPILVIGVALFALFFLLSFLVPIFGDLYSRLGQNLPALTESIIQLSEQLQLMARPLGIIVLILIATGYTQRKKAWFRAASAIILLHIPIFGKLIRKVYLGRFSQAMAFLLEAHVPALQAIELSQKMVQFYPIEHALKAVKEELFNGMPLHKSMSKFDIFPKRLIALVRVGEEANQLGNMFKKLADQYNTDVEQQTKLLGSLIEPVIIIFLALVVGLILVAMYLPIFKLVTNFGL